MVPKKINNGGSFVNGASYTGIYFSQRKNVKRKRTKVIKLLILSQKCLKKLKGIK